MAAVLVEGDAAAPIAFAAQVMNEPVELSGKSINALATAASLRGLVESLTP